MTAQPEDPTTTVEDGDGGFIARGFDGENHGFGLLS